MKLWATLKDRQTGGSFTNMPDHATKKLTEFIENLKYSDFNPDVIAAAKASLLDFIGVAIAGAGEPRWILFCPGENH